MQPSSGAASWTPAQAVASRGEGRGACPRATDEQLVGVGQGVCALPSRKEGRTMRGEVCGPGGGRMWAGGSARAGRTMRSDAGRGVGRETGGRGPAAAHERHARREGPAVEAGGG
eukprot:scaffold39268_cov62-Phaeocystis_antarctica.AAC.1